MSEFFFYVFLIAFIVGLPLVSVYDHVRHNGWSIYKKGPHDER